ncbi:MAG: NUDIX domain-containing protein [Alphaproteobacteria bacterium]|nr:MAG: NUDIX domain-containing protein [Alphaproteobacteria bacterium]
MMAKHVSFDGTDVQVLTLVYAVRDGWVLTLERAATKRFLPGWFVGLGGKVERGENVFAGAAREFEEETGMRVTGLSLRGSYTFVTEMPENRCGVIYLFVGDGVEGEFVADVADGTLRWMTVDELMASDKVMPDHKVWLGRIFENDDHFACLGSWEEGARAVEWADSLGYYQKLKI